jgi:hypothetical protein
MKRRSESRLRYFAVSGLTPSPYSAIAAQVERSARRTTVQAKCSWAAAGVPPGRMKLRSFSSSAR